ncbi:MAG: hypothetical protein AB7E77_12010 [Desulfobulbus sp.]
MIIKPMLDSFELPCIESIRCLERRRLANHAVPGLSGDLYQDLGAESLRVEIVGSLQGDDKRDQFLETIREKFNSGEPLPFVADILTATELEEVVIEQLEIGEHNQWDRPMAYRLVLGRYVEPPEPVRSFDDLGLELDTELDLLADLGLDGLELPDLLMEIPTVGNPVEPILPALDGTDGIVSGLGSLLDDFSRKFTG